MNVDFAYGSESCVSLCFCGIGAQLGILDIIDVQNFAVGGWATESLGGGRDAAKSLGGVVVAAAKSLGGVVVAV